MASVPERAADASSLAELRGAQRVFALIVNADREPRHVSNVRDAKRALLSNGVAAANIRVVSHASGGASAQALRRAVAALTEELRSDDGIVVYITGHGEPHGIVLSDGVMKHEELVTLLESFEPYRSVFVFDACHAGALPWLLTERGSSGYAMAPTAEGKASHCQLFAPHFWSALERRLDIDDDGSASFTDAFRLAMGLYNQNRKRLGMRPVDGAYSAPIPELANKAQLSGDAVILELTSAWCGACRLQEQRLAYLRLLVGPAIKIFRLDIIDNPAAKQVVDRNNAVALPQLLFFSGGKVKHESTGLMSLNSLLRHTTDAFGRERVDGQRLLAELAEELDGTNRARVRLAIRELAQFFGTGALDAHDSERLARAFRKELRSLEGKPLVDFVDHVRAADAHGKLVARLSRADRATVTDKYEGYYDKRAARGLAGLESGVDQRRGTAWLDLWRATSKPGVYFELFVPALVRLARLKRDGDEEQERIASFLIDRISSLKTQDGKPARIDNYRYPGASSSAAAALNKAFEAHFEKHGLDINTMLRYVSRFLVLSHYYDSAYLDIVVDSAELRALPTGGLELVIAVTEGPRYRWGDVAVTEVSDDGTKVPPLGGQRKIESFLSPRAGQLAVRSQLSAGVSALTRHYGDAGYLEATVTPKLRCDGKSRRCSVDVRIERGARIRLGRVHVKGNHEVSTARITRMLLVTPGRWASETALDKSRDRVRALPEIAQVSLSITRSPTSAHTRDVWVEVEEY